MNAHLDLAMAQLVPLAAKELDKNKVTPGVLGFIVFAVMGVGVWFLMKSMNRHMGKVNFEEAPDPGRPAGGDATKAGPQAGPGTKAGTPTAAGQEWSSRMTPDS